MVRPNLTFWLLSTPAPGLSAAVAGLAGLLPVAGHGEGMKRLVERSLLACGSVGYRVALSSQRGTAEAASSTLSALQLAIGFFFSSRLYFSAPQHPCSHYE